MDLEELRDRSAVYARQLGLTGPELRAFVEGILAASRAAAPASSASGSPNPLHPSVLALVVHKHATEFAQRPEGLGLATVSQAKAFADRFLPFTSPGPAETFIAYTKAYEFATDYRRLSLTASQAQKFVNRIFALSENAAQLAMTYIEVFSREQERGASADEAQRAADQAICLPAASSRG